MPGNREKEGGWSGLNYVPGHVHDGRVTRGADEERNLVVFSPLMWAEDLFVYGTQKWNIGLFSR